MRALLLKKPGSFSKMEFSQVKKPKLKAGYLRVKVEAVGLNPVDCNIAERGHEVFKYPVVLGFDVAGVVDSVSPEEPRWREGDKVYFHTGIAGTGGFAEYLLVDARAISRLPEGLSFIEAAAIPCAGFTAYQALVKRMEIKAGNTILILGGSGGVGTFAIQIACALGLNVISTCSTDNVEFLETLGARHVVDYKSEDIKQSVLAILKENNLELDYILDTVSSESALSAMSILKYGGAVACIAGLPDLTKLDRIARPFSLHSVMLGSAELNDSPEAVDELKAMGDELGSMVANGAVHPVIDSVIGFDEILEGLERIAGRHVRGKIVASIGELSERQRISDLRWTQDKPDPETVRIPPNTGEFLHPDSFWNAFYWGDLTAREKRLWKILGWSARSWRGDKGAPESFNKGWKVLNDAERQAARELGYGKGTWNSEES